MNEEESEDYFDENINFQSRSPTSNFYDTKTQLTATDALVCKYSAVLLGYYDDVYLRSIFESSSCFPKGIRKPPIINRGYYARVKSMDVLIELFLSHFPNEYCQIINLGCGYDTVALKYLDLHPNLYIYEIDFPEVIASKVKLCLSQQLFKQTLLLDKQESKSVDIHHPQDFFNKGEKYVRLGNARFIPLDLRDHQYLQQSLHNAGALPNAPTFILSECVLLYINRQAVDYLSEMFATSFHQAIWVTYDMVNPSDPFGSTMLRNLQAAQFSIPGFLDYPTLDKQIERFTLNGWQNACSMTMLDAYNKIISVEDKRRIGALEIFDEIEEWELIMNHYSITVAVNGKSLTDALQLF
jgi:O-methyltransferase involved in polyketide biosynthesis